MADDDFRTTIEFTQWEGAHEIAGYLHSKELAQELRERLGDHLVVTRDGNELFLYSATARDGQRTAETVTGLIAQHGFDATVKPLERWHPIEKAWEDASEPLPADGDAAATEHKAWEIREAADSLEDNLAEWEVRIELDSHGGAVELAEKLESEGISPIVRRWKYLLVGAANEDGARELAQRLEGELPSGGEVKVEPAPVWFYEGVSRHPISAMFGGLPQPGDQK